MQTRDNFSEFYRSYLDNIIDISSNTMISQMGKIDQDLLSDGICWLVTDNIRLLLAVDAEEPNALIAKNISSSYYIIRILERELSNNRLVIINQDPDDQDHWFAIIGDWPNIHIIEHLPEQCNASQTWKLNEFLIYFQRIITGLEPDRFYKKSIPHSYLILSHERVIMNDQLVYDYIH